MDTTSAEPTARPAPRRRLWLRVLLLAPLLLVLLSVVQVLLLRFVDPPFSSFMLGRQVDYWLAGEWKAVRYDWRDLEDIAPSLPLSMIAAEDQNFARHRGFDLAAIEKARASNARGRKLRGASTISQQTAKNLFLWQGQSLPSRAVRKGAEAWYTLLIELLWPKRRILEVYVNVAELGDGVYGAQAAARHYWRKDARQLTSGESARLAAILPAPKRYSAARPGPYVQRRAAWIQRQVGQLGGPAYLRELD